MSPPSGNRPAERAQGRDPACWPNVRFAALRPPYPYLTTANHEPPHPVTRPGWRSPAGMPLALRPYGRPAPNDVPGGGRPVPCGAAALDGRRRPWAAGATVITPSGW